MSTNGIKILVFVGSLLIGVLVMFSPVFITGSYYDVTKVFGGLLIAELVVRVIAVIVGFIIIYDGLKTILKD